MTPRRAAFLVLSAALWVAVPISARAQGTPPPPIRGQGTPASPARAETPAWEVAVSGTWARGLSIGAIAGTETTPTGSGFSLFTAQSRLDNAPGVSLAITRHMAGVFSVEADGRFAMPTYRTAVLSDFEDATLTEATNTGTEFGIVGAAVVTFGRHARVQPFVRAGGGWRRELSEDGTLSSDGRLVIVGGGVKYWWGAHPATARVGLRADVGVIGRSGGLALGDAMRFAPAAAAGLSFRF